jgi:hypothetical protein
VKAKELALEILAMIENGELDPDAIVVRPFCMCDEVHGWIEARFVDSVFRKPIKSDSDLPMFKYGNSDDSDAILTVKLG